MIPKIIHRIWLGGPMPDVYDNGHTLEHHHPGWEHRLWTDTDLDDGTWDMQPILDRADELAPPDDVTRFRVDVWRLELLHRFGGIYIDCDAVALRPFDALLDRTFVAESPNVAGVATNAVMGCEPGHHFLEALLDGVEERAERMGGRRVVEAVGGYYLTELLPQHPDVEMLPWWRFCSQSIRTRDLGLPPDSRNVEEGYADHLYGNSLHGGGSRWPFWIRRARWMLADLVDR